MVRTISPFMWFIVDERSFPKAVEMMKDLYCEE